MGLNFNDMLKSEGFDPGISNFKNRESQTIKGFPVAVEWTPPPPNKGAARFGEPQRPRIYAGSLLSALPSHYVAIIRTRS